MRIHAGLALLAACAGSDGGQSFADVGNVPVVRPMDSDDPSNNHAWRLLPEATDGGRLVFTDGGATWEAAALTPTDIAWLSWGRLAGPEGVILSIDFHASLGVALAQSGEVWRTLDDGVYRIGL